jgi:sulfotransferase
MLTKGVSVLNNNPENKIVLLAGLRRTGSTLLQNLLAQNPTVYTEGNSALCQVMWDTKLSCEHNAREQLIGVGKDISFKNDLLKGISNVYYPDVKGKTIFDKCRPWVNEANIDMARKFIDNDIKSIVMVRPLDEIAASYARVMSENNIEFLYETLFDEHGAFMHEFSATYYAAKTKDPSFLFVSYDDLVNKPQKTLSAIYSHLGMQEFIHNTHKIKQVVFEDDERNNMRGMHDIRPKVSKQDNKFILPDWVRSACQNMTKALFVEIDAVKKPVFRYNTNQDGLLPSLELMAAE